MAARATNKAPNPRISGPFFAGRICAALLLAVLSPAVWPQSVTDPWSDALAERDLAAIEQLLELGRANPNRPAPDGRTALMIAARAADAEVVVQLLAAGADANAVTLNGGTPLMFAVLGGDETIVALLLDAGARHEAQAKLGWTALALAAVKGYVQVVDVLLDAGADQRICDAYGWTPLMRAVDIGRLEVARMLLDAPGVDLSAQQESGATALHIAAATGDDDIVQLLVERGADRSMTDSHGNTPAAIATASGHVKIAKYLESLDRPPRSGGS